jgi:ATP-dependent Clp protease protease subunit
MRHAPEARYVIPEFRERSAQGERIHNPYTKLFEERIVFLGVQIDDTSADDIMAQLLCLESMDPDRDISIYINSPGGSYTAMTAIYDTMQFVKPDIHTACLGQAASAAAVILAAGHIKPDKVAHTVVGGVGRADADLDRLGGEEIKPGANCCDAK